MNEKYEAGSEKIQKKIWKKLSRWQREACRKIVGIGDGLNFIIS